MNIKLTAIVITMFLLLVPIAFADHAKFATRTGNYMTGTIFAGEQTKIDQIQKRIQEINDLVAQHEGYIKEFPQYTVFNQGQIDILNAEKKKLQSELLPLLMAQYGLTPDYVLPDYVTSPMKLIEYPGGPAIPTQPTTPSTTPSTNGAPSTTPTQPAPEPKIYEPGIYDIVAPEPGFSIPSPQTRTEKQYTHLTPESGYSSTKYTTIEIRPDVYTHVSDTSTMMPVSAADLTPTYYPALPSSREFPSGLPEQYSPQGVTYGADTVLPGNVPLTAEQLNDALYQIGYYFGVIAAKEDFHMSVTHPYSMYEGSQFTPSYGPSAISDTNIYEAPAYSTARERYGQLGIREVSK